MRLLQFDGGTPSLLSLMKKRLDALQDLLNYALSQLVMKDFMELVRINNRTIMEVANGTDDFKEDKKVF